MITQTKSKYKGIEPVTLSELIPATAPDPVLTLKDLQPGDIFRFRDIHPSECLGYNGLPQGGLGDKRDTYLVIADANAPSARIFPDSWGSGFGIVLLEKAMPKTADGSCRMSNIKGTNSNGKFPQSPTALRDQPVIVLARIKGGLHTD